jgi:hypothetical protein
MRPPRRRNSQTGDLKLTTKKQDLRISLRQLLALLLAALVLLPSSSVYLDIEDNLTYLCMAVSGPLSVLLALGNWYETRIWNRNLSWIFS